MQKVSNKDNKPYQVQFAKDIQVKSVGETLSQLRSRFSPTSPSSRSNSIVSVHRLSEVSDEVIGTHCAISISQIETSQPNPDGESSVSPAMINSPLAAAGAIPKRYGAAMVWRDDELGKELAFHFIFLCGFFLLAQTDHENKQVAVKPSNPRPPTMIDSKNPKKKTNDGTIDQITTNHIVAYQITLHLQSPPWDCSDKSQPISLEQMISSNHSTLV